MSPSGDPCVPERFAQGVFLRGERHVRRLAPDRDVGGHPAGRAEDTGQDTIFAPVGLLLLAAAFGALPVGVFRSGSAY